MGLPLSASSFRLVKEGTERINSVRTKTREQSGRGLGGRGGGTGRCWDSKDAIGFESPAREQGTRLHRAVSLFAILLIQWRTCPIALASSPPLFFSLVLFSRFHPLPPPPGANTREFCENRRESQRDHLFSSPCL